MGTIAARNLDTVLDNIEGVLACELLGALTAADLRRPMRSGNGTAAAYACARTVIAELVTDRSPAPDIVAARKLLRDGTLVAAAASATRSPERSPAT